MDGPVKKKLKVKDTLSEDLDLVQKSILNQCLCTVPESSLRRPFRDIKVVSQEDSQGRRTTVVAEWRRESTLQFLSTIQLLCEVAIKQNAKGLVCSRISDVIDALIRNEQNLVDHLIELGAHSDSFVCFSAERALTAFLIVSRAHVDPRWLDRLTENAVHSTHPYKMAFSFETFKRIIEWKDWDEHPLDDRNGENNPPASCHVLSINDPEILDSTHIKCLCIKALEAKWTSIIGQFGSCLDDFSQNYEATVVTFLGLWEAIISIKANLSIIDTKPFYAHLEGFVSMLNSNVPPIVWKQLLNLFNEVLCYGSTLALQDVLAEEPCSLAHLVVRSVKDWRLLDSLPYRIGNGRFGGGAGDGDKPLLQKMVLLVLKAVAVTVKETRCESSSDSSIGSEAEDAAADMAMIERSIREVLRQLDSCVKTLLPFHPATPLAQWVVQLFMDQDDALIESMVCCLDVTVGLLYWENASPDMRRALSPAISFVQFLRSVSHDHTVLLDLLVSNETCFLLYLLRLLKYIVRNWLEFVSVCDRGLEDTMGVLHNLRTSIDRLVSKRLFPYNINPILKYLTKCEQMYNMNPNRSVAVD